ncbi:MAG: response regulator, partial [Candidatus Marinimicrobia bacterium]|nr:response regulator [Candidatus Neomarinimicrobiota bacterium]
KSLVLRDITEKKKAEAEREKLIRDLQEALNQVKTLSGLLPICSHCKKIRDDKGYWSEVETYIHSHSDVDFSHGICPECLKKYYPEIADRMESKNAKKTP